MRWWGKATGGVAGFAFLGPVGALIGTVLGHGFDRGLSEELDQPRPRRLAYPFRETLLEATFSVMGYLAALGGAVSTAEKRVRDLIIDELELDSARAREARRAFDSGSRSGFNPDRQLRRLAEVTRGRRELRNAFLDMQLRVALANGGISGNTRVALKRLCKTLGFSAVELAQAETLARLRASTARAVDALREHDDPVRAACQVLGVATDADAGTVKKAYRRLMNRNHPDKLVGQDLDQDALDRARERTHEIRMAYETVMTARRP